MITAKTGVTTYTLPNDRQIVLTRVFDAPRTMVFDAWTNPKHLPKWFTGPEGMTMPICEMDLRPDGKWRYVYRKANGKEMTVSGIVKEVVPPELLVTTESWYPDEGECHNRWDFVESTGQTTVTLTMTFESKQMRDMAIETGMSGGIDASFDRLDDLLSELA